MCDFSGLTTGNQRVFAWQASRGKLLSPDQLWCTARALQFPKGVAVNPLAGHVLPLLLALMPLYLPWYPSLRPLVQKFFQMPLPKNSLWVNKGETQKALFYSYSVTNTFLLNSLPHSLPNSETIKLTEPFVQDSLNHEMN